MTEWKPLFSEAEHRLASPTPEPVSNRQFLWVFLTLVMITGVLIYFVGDDAVLSDPHPGGSMLPAHGSAADKIHTA